MSTDRGSNRLFLILSVSSQHRISGQLSREEQAQLSPEHREYHRSSREQDTVLIKSMIRPSPGLPRGARCMILQAPSREALEAWMLKNPLMKYDAHAWDIREITPEGGLDGVVAWLEAGGVEIHANAEAGQ